MIILHINIKLDYSKQIIKKSDYSEQFTTQIGLSIGKIWHSPPKYSKVQTHHNPFKFTSCQNFSINVSTLSTQVAEIIRSRL